MEVKCFELQDKLEEEGKMDDGEIEEQVGALRKKLLEELERGGGGVGDAGRKRAGLKSHQVHELAEAKEKEMRRMEKALGISPDYEEVGILISTLWEFMTDNFCREVIGRDRRSENSTASLVVHRRTPDYNGNNFISACTPSFSPLVPYPVMIITTHINMSPLQLVWDKIPHSVLCVYIFFCLLFLYFAYMREWVMGFGNGISFSSLGFHGKVHSSVDVVHDA